MRTCYSGIHDASYFCSEGKMERKEYMLRVRLTPAEQARAQQLADLTGGNVSDMVRALIKDARVIVRPSIVEVETVQSNGMILA